MKIVHILCFVHRFITIITQMRWHVQNCAECIWLEFEIGQNEKSTKFVWRWKILIEIGLWIMNDTKHYSDVVMGARASQIMSLTIVYSTVYSGADQRKHQRSASLAIVRRIHRWPVNSPHKWPVTRKVFPFDDVIMSIVSQYRYKRTIGYRLGI